MESKIKFYNFVPSELFNSVEMASSLDDITQLPIFRETFGIHMSHLCNEHDVIRLSLGLFFIAYQNLTGCGCWSLIFHARPVSFRYINHVTTMFTYQTPTW